MLTANGVELAAVVHNLTSLTGRWTTPPRRGGDILIPGRHGALRATGKKFGPGTVTLPMWVTGDTVAGTRANLDTLTRVFAADTVELVHTPPGGVARRVTGQVLDVVEFSALPGATSAQFSVSLTTAGAFWEDVATVTASKTGTSGTWEVTEFAGATAPMDDLKVKFTGPATNPRVTNPTGVYVAYNAALTGSQTVTIDCATWSFPAADQVGITPTLSALAHGGDPRWFVLEPRDPNPQVTASQTAGTTGVFQLVGRRKYLIG